MVDLLTYDEDRAFGLMDDAATVNRVVRTTSAERLRETRFGDWSAVELIGHLTDVAEVFAERVRRALDEDVPALPAIPDGLVVEPGRDPLDLARRLLAAHRRIVALLQAPGARDRPAIHGEWGRVTAGHIAAYQADHSCAHVSELAAAFPPG